MEYQNEFTPTIKAALSTALKNEKIIVNSVCREWSESGHKDCAAIDFNLSTLPDQQGAADWLNTLNLVCEAHRNLDVNAPDYKDQARDIVRPIGTPNTHLHCEDKYRLDVQEEPKVAQIETMQALGVMTVTSYNPEVGQTDSTPCIAGGNNIDICQMAKDGRRAIAASQDLLTWAGGYPFKAYSKIWLESIDFPDDPRCNGEFEVVDGMNKRFAKRLDIFFMERKDNISCRANIYLVK